MNERVKLIKEITQDLPIGSLGTIIEGDLNDSMVIVQWDKGFSIPMYRGEIQEID